MKKIRGAPNPIWNIVFYILFSPIFILILSVSVVSFYFYILSNWAMSKLERFINREQES